MNHNWINVPYAILALLICLAAGYGINTLIGGLPPSLYGMVVLTIALQLKWINADRVSACIAWGIRHMGVCFVPAGVGIIEHENLIKQHGLAIVLITFLTTFLLLSFVGIAYQNYEKRIKKNSNTHEQT